MLFQVVSTATGTLTNYRLKSGNWIDHRASTSTTTEVTVKGVRKKTSQQTTKSVYSVRDRIEINFQNRGDWYPGTIEAVIDGTKPSDPKKYNVILGLFVFFFFNFFA